MKTIFLLSILFTISVLAQAQQDFTIDAKEFTVSPVTVISTDNNVINFKSSTVSGNAMHVLLGESQTITSLVEQRFYNLVIAGNGEKTFNGDFFICKGL